MGKIDKTVDKIKKPGFFTPPTHNVMDFKIPGVYKQSKESKKRDRLRTEVLEAEKEILKRVPLLLEALINYYTKMFK